MPPMPPHAAFQPATTPAGGGLRPPLAPPTCRRKPRQQWCHRRMSVAPRIDATAPPSPIEQPVPDAVEASAPPSPDDTAPPSPPASRRAPIIVPGKFDSFHIGHRRLVEEAAKLGAPVLLSFSGMPTALGWRPRPPVVAAVERDRVLREMSVAAGVALSWQVLPFDTVRSMSPRQFLDFIRARFGAAGIASGADWRFGKDRAGDVSLLRAVAAETSLVVRTVDAVDVDGIVSSTRVRAALADGDAQLVSVLLGRYHRLVGYVVAVDGDGILCGDFVNMAPGDGRYDAIVRVIGRSEPFQAQVEVRTMGNGEATARLFDAERIYCADCEIYIDFVQRVTDDGGK